MNWNCKTKKYWNTIFLFFQGSKILDSIPNTVKFIQKYWQKILSFPFLFFISHIFLFFLILFYSFRTTLCLQYTSSQIAMAAIFLATIQLNVKPLNPSKFRNSVEHSWFELLEPDIDDDILKSKYLHFKWSLLYLFSWW